MKSVLAAALLFASASFADEPDAGTGELVAVEFDQGLTCADHEQHVTELPPGVYFPQPAFEKLDAEFVRLQTEGCVGADGGVVVREPAKDDHLVAELSVTGGIALVLGIVLGVIAAGAKKP